MVKDDQINNGIPLWFTTKKIAGVNFFRVPVADVAFSAFRKASQNARRRFFLILRLLNSRTNIVDKKERSYFSLSNKNFRSWLRSELFINLSLKGYQLLIFSLTDKLQSTHKDKNIYCERIF